MPTQVPNLTPGHHPSGEIFNLPATMLAATLLLLSACAEPGDSASAVEDRGTVAKSAADAVRQPDSLYHYDDIDRFFESCDAYLVTAEPEEFASYLGGGSVGLNDFQEQFALTPDSLADRVQKYPAFFGSLRDLKPMIQAREPDLDVMFERLQAMFPDHPMPEVYFLVGGLRAGGQAGDGNYVMVAAELYTEGTGVDASELSPRARRFPPEDIVHIVAHEAAHIIQEDIQGTERYLSLYTEEGEGTLLAYALREGVPNLIAKLVSGDHINGKAEMYGLAHEAELWPEFREQALSTDLGDWFFYRPKIHPDWPRDLGYWMGYRLAQNCYEKAADKAAMLRRLLSAADPEALLADCAPGT